jgi:UDP-N-acetylmuramyl pentapeptide phosphotransferase/UDP-N-acetylglucosamine-1-phosphate transferase
VRDRHRRTSQIGLVVAGGVVILAGFGVGLVEALQLPKGSIWLVVGAAALVVAGVRWLTRRGG